MQLKKALLASAIAALSTSAFAMEAMDDEMLSGTTGQDGLSVLITPPGSGITADIVWHDVGGFSTFTESGAVVITGFSMTGAIQLDIDATGDINSATTGNQAALRIDVSLPTGTTINTGAISVAHSSGPTAYTLSDQTGTILNSMAISIGSGSLATVNLGNEPNGGAMINVNTTLTGGLSISNFAVNDTGGSFTGGSINVGSLLVRNRGDGNLAANIAVDATATGLRLGLTQLGTAGASPTGGMNITMVDVGLGSTVPMGDVQILGLNMNGGSITIAGKN